VPPAVLLIQNTALDPLQLLDAERRATLLAVGGSGMAGIGASLLERWVRRRVPAISLPGVELRGHPLAAALFSDYLAIPRGSVIDFAAAEAEGEVLSGLVWRAGRAARRLVAGGLEPIEAERAVELGIADALVPAGEDPVEWLRSWIGNRSLHALASAARLVRSSRSMAGERFEFARLFSTGEPGRGLASFLQKTPPPFQEATVVEIV
jgi:hypothetical protein